MTRLLQANEVPHCVEGGRMFFDEGKLPGGFDPGHFCRTWQGLIESKRGVVISSWRDADTITGALGAVLCPSLFSGKIMAVECFWYVIPQHRGHGLKLLRHFERWAHEQGVHFLSMIHLKNLQPELLGAVYERMGYRAVETNYLKEI